METKLEWMMILSSLHGRTKLLECSDISLDKVLNDESFLHKKFQDDPQVYETLKNLINPNEKQINKEFISMLESYVVVVKALSDYLESSDDKAGLKLEQLSKDNSRFSGKFRGAIKYFLKFGQIETPKIALKVYEHDGIDPLHRIVLRHYSDDVDESKKAEFVGVLKQTLDYDLVFRNRYHNAVLETDRFFSDLLAQKYGTRTTFFQSNKTEYC